MTIPDRSHIRKMVLDCLNDGLIYSMKDLYNFILKQSKFEANEINRLLPSKWETVFNNKIRWAKTDLINWNLIKSPKRNQFQITEIGRSLLKKMVEDYIDEKLLSLYDVAEKIQRVAFEHDNKIIDNRTYSKDKQVFLSYSNHDKEIAKFLASKLRNANLKISLHDWSLDINDSFLSQINKNVSSSDIIIILLSPNSVDSKWLKEEFNEIFVSELNNRAIAILPLVIKDCKIPKELANKKFIDLRTNVDGGVSKLINQLYFLPFIDYSFLNAKSFEELICDLLRAIGFSIKESMAHSDFGYDLIIEIENEDPFGIMQREKWYVVIKFYKDKRVSVETLFRLNNNLNSSLNRGKGLVITNGQITSVSRELLSDLSHNKGTLIRVIDGVELTNLISQYPNIVRKYFIREENQ